MSKWPYENEVGQTQEDCCDVLVLGGGLAGVMRQSQQLVRVNLSY